MAQEELKRLMGEDYPIMVDPTLLLSVYDWNNMAGDSPIIKGKYVFLYTPWYEKPVFDAAMAISKDLGTPVVVSQLYDSWKRNSWIVDKSYKSHISTGPKEFLNLCKFATCVVGASFHVAVFSILFKTPFYAVDGMKDSRVAELLTMTGLESRSWDTQYTCKISLDVNFEQAIGNLDCERRRCVEWLRQKLM